jgi:hypothetical protein
MDRAAHYGRLPLRQELHQLGANATSLLLRNAMKAGPPEGGRRSALSIEQR